jgi:MOSC domain-containing protein YiiM
MAGTVEHIHLAAEYEGTPEPTPEVAAEAGQGLHGDRYFGDEDAGDITLVEAEVLERMSAEHGIDLPDGASRRNVTTRGIDLGELVGRRFRVGEAVCEGEERCEPCLHLTKVTGEPGVLRGLVHSGLRAAIVESGTIRVGDPVEALP